MTNKENRKFLDKFIVEVLLYWHSYDKIEQYEMKGVDSFDFMESIYTYDSDKFIELLPSINAKVLLNSFSHSIYDGHLADVYISAIENRFIYQVDHLGRKNQMNAFNEEKIMKRLKRLKLTNTVMLDRLLTPEVIEEMEHKMIDMELLRRLR